jgi:DNA mismatch repair protein MutS2
VVLTLLATGLQTNLYKIKLLIASGCRSEIGKTKVEEMKVLNDHLTIGRLLRLTEELKDQILSGESFPDLQVSELRHELEKSSVIGYFMTSEALFRLKFNLEVAESCKSYFITNKDAYPLWKGSVEMVEIPAPLQKQLKKVFERNGEIKDGASTALKKIRQDIKNLTLKARKELESILRQARDKGYTDKDSSLTIRDGRLVIPLQAEHKRHLKGLVVDESTTGKTIFLEPLQVFNLNNTIRELHFAEKREVIAILTALTTIVAQYKDHLERIEGLLAELDFTRAKAKLAVQLDAIRPSFGNTNNLSLIQARHPVLLLTNQKLGLPVVPLDIEINDNQRVIVISGPNAGGKSVCLKTVGLLQMMLQAGMLVPVGEPSVMGCFNQIFVDIGDEQSIESDLSTYSSHLRNMKYFLDHCAENSLFLIDEFGTGTEPQFGGAIAESILKGLVFKQSRGLVTTHYGNLKKYADQASGVINAAMRFDLKKLSPQYSLDLGRPGSSFALEIAAKIGLPEQILKEAKSMVGHDPVAFETLVSELELEKQKYLEYNRANQNLQRTLEQQRQSYEEKLAELQGSQKEIVNNAKIAAQRLLAEANQRIEATIRSIKESKADKPVTHRARRDLNDFRERNKPEKTSKPQQVKIVPGPIAPGDLVKVKDSQAQGEVLSISGKTAEILMGSLKSKIRLSRLQKIGKASTGAVKPGKTNIEIYKKREKFSSELDVRGLRAAQALSAVTDFIDEGLLLGITNLRILHGKGDGILRSVIRRYLEEDPSVMSFNDEHVERGGAGVTLVTLN